MQQGRRPTIKKQKVLAAVLFNPGLTASGISSLTGISYPHCSRSLYEMAALGLVCGMAKEKDKRLITYWFPSKKNDAAKHHPAWKSLQLVKEALSGDESPIAETVS